MSDVSDVSDMSDGSDGGKTIGSNRGYEAKFLSHACQATAEFVHLLDEGFVILAAEMVC